MEKFDWNQLLHEALTMPGKLSSAYFAMHNYSLCNRVLATAQLNERGLPVSPIASFNRWKELGRKVKKGEKALALFLPIKIRKRNDASDANEETEKIPFKGFILKKFWFSMNQTEGEAYEPELLVPEWNYATALAALGIREEVFSDINGNKMGYSVPCEGVIAVNPLNPLPWKTRFHEMAHCLLHTEAAMLSDGKVLDDSLIEVEAESVAYLCCSSLGLPGLEESRGYIQYWLRKSKSRQLAGKNIQRVFGAANKILSAGSKGGNYDNA